MQRTDTLSEETEETLIRLYGAGDLGAADALSRRIVPGLLGYVARMLGDGAEAEDVVQEVMLALWQGAGSWRAGEASVRTWAYKVATNRAIDRIRRRKPLAPIEAAGDPVAPDPDGEAQVLAAERVRMLDAALATLPDRQRQAVILRHIEGMANPEIAGIMDISVEAVESLTARGKRMLADRLGAMREEDERKDE